MTATWSIRPVLIPPRAAFGQLLRTEALLLFRHRTAMILGLAMPVGLVVAFGEIPGSGTAHSYLDGLSYFDVYLPILLVFALSGVGLFGMPLVLAGYRDEGVLRRLATTPVRSSWVLAAQLIVNFCLAVISIIIMMLVWVGAFGIPAPQNPGGFLIAALLAIAALFALGLWVGAFARSSTGARVVGQFFFIPLMFFAGLWLPQQVMPAVLRDISHYTPVGAAVQALHSAVGGTFPPTSSLLVMAAYAVVFGALAVRSFKWE